MPTTLVELKHGYDLAGNRLYRYDQVARDLSKSFDELYGYDDLNRLTAFDRGQLGMGNDSITGPTLSQSWSLDPQGNWKGFTQSAVNALTQTREHNEANEITDISKSVGADWPTPTYGTHKNGNTLTFPNPRSLTAELSGTYDAWNRLVKLEGGPTVAEYQYDGMNRRIIKDADSVTRHFYHSDQWQVLEERTDSNTSADRQYVWGQRYVDDLVLRDHDSTRLYALSDALFNVVALTDDDGAVVERFAYRAYGESLELDPDFDQPYTGTDYEWEYRFTGRELDLESGLQLNRNRYLHLQLGRWLTRDPIEYEAREWNLYRYVDVLPTLNLDPNGTEIEIVLYCLANELTRYSLTCAEICAMYKKDPKNDTTGGGGVVCYRGIKCPCGFNFPPKPRDVKGYTVGECPDIDAIVTEHEIQHLPDVDCPKDTPKPIRPEWSKRDDKKNLLIECRHRDQSIKLLEALENKQPPLSVRCMNLARRRIRELNDTQRIKNCPGWQNK